MSGREKGREKEKAREIGERTSVPLQLKARCEPREVWQGREAHLLHGSTYRLSMSHVTWTTSTGSYGTSTLPSS
jgi:hypothetical protein